MHSLNELAFIFFTLSCFAGFIVGTYMGVFFVLNARNILKKYDKLSTDI